MNIILENLSFWRLLVEESWNKSLESNAQPFSRYQALTQSNVEHEISCSKPIWPKWSNSQFLFNIFYTLYKASKK